MPEINDMSHAAEVPVSEDTNEKTEGKEIDQKEEDEWIDVLGSGQLKMKVVQKGEEHTRPEAYDICNISLIGKLEDGTVVEEFSSLRVGVGENEVVQGLDLVLPLMDVGSKVIADVAPRFAYGSQGLNSIIPPDSKITYEVELLKVDPEPVIETIPHEKRKLMANTKKSRGNWWYARQDPNKAIQCYRKALELLDCNIPYEADGTKEELSESMFQNFIEEKMMIYNNLAAAQIQIEAYESALVSVDHVLSCEPMNVKALFRKGKIYETKGVFEEAIKYLKQANELEPENTAVKKLLSQCLKKTREDKLLEKSLYKKMLGQDKVTEKPYPCPKPTSNSWTKVIKSTAAAAVVTVVAVAVGYKCKSYGLL